MLWQPQAREGGARGRSRGESRRTVTLLSFPWRSPVLPNGNWPLVTFTSSSWTDFRFIANRTRSGRTRSDITSPWTTASSSCRGSPGSQERAIIGPWTQRPKTCSTTVPFCDVASDSSALSLRKPSSTRTCRTRPRFLPPAPWSPIPRTTPPPTPTIHSPWLPITCRQSCTPLVLPVPCRTRCWPTTPRHRWCHRPRQQTHACLALKTSSDIQIAFPTLPTCPVRFTWTRVAATVSVPRGQLGLLLATKTGIRPHPEQDKAMTRRRATTTPWALRWALRR